MTNSTVYRFQCVSCGQKIKARTNPVGAQVICPAPSCGVEFVVEKQNVVVQAIGDSQSRIDPEKPFQKKVSTMPKTTRTRQPSKKVAAEPVNIPPVEEVQEEEVQEEESFIETQEEEHLPPAAPVPQIQAAPPRNNTLLIILVVAVLFFGWEYVKGRNAPAPQPAPVPAPDNTPAPVVDTKADELASRAKVALDGDKDAAAYFAAVSARVAELLEKDSTDVKRFNRRELLGESLVSYVGHYSVANKYQKTFKELPALIADQFAPPVLGQKVGEVSATEYASVVQAWKDLAKAFDAVAKGTAQ